MKSPITYIHTYIHTYKAFVIRCYIKIAAVLKLQTKYYKMISNKIDAKYMNKQRWKNNNSSRIQMSL